MSTAVQYLGGSPEVAVPLPDGGVALFSRGSGGRPGKPVEVPDDVAGTEPQEWRRVVLDDEGNLAEDIPAHWHGADSVIPDGEGVRIIPVRILDDEGFRIVQDPGSGLLAQHEQFRRAKQQPADSTGEGVSA